MRGFELQCLQRESLEITCERFAYEARH